MLYLIPRVSCHISCLVIASVCRDKNTVLFTEEWLLDFVLDAAVEELREKASHLEDYWKRGTPTDAVDAIARGREAMPSRLDPGIAEYCLLYTSPSPRDS